MSEGTQLGKAIRMQGRINYEFNSIKQDNHTWAAIELATIGASKNTIITHYQFDENKALLPGPWQQTMICISHGGQLTMHVGMVGEGDVIKPTKDNEVFSCPYDIGWKKEKANG